jgi:hypothetical protein
VTFTSFNVNPSVGAVVKEQVNFQVDGPISYTADS